MTNWVAIPWELVMKGVREAWAYWAARGQGYRTVDDVDLDKLWDDSKQNDR